MLRSTLTQLLLSNYGLALSTASNPSSVSQRYNRFCVDLCLLVFRSTTLTRGKDSHPTGSNERSSLANGVRHC